jgi:hypothetical protein
MSWESRKRGSKYYTRSRRVDGRVTRTYIGTGPAAELIASLDELKRLEKEEEELHFKEELERFEEAVVFLNGLEEAAKIMTTAHLLAAGAHRYKGTWRFKHG